MSYRSILVSALELSPEPNIEDIAYFTQVIENDTCEYNELRQIAEITASVSEGVLWEATMKIGKPLTLFLAPPTDCCLHCGSSLQIHHEPTTVICFTLNGPVPAQKVTLRCKKCQISYRYEQYGNREKGYQYYPQPRPMVHGSQLMYMDRHCCALLRASRYV